MLALPLRKFAWGIVGLWILNVGVCIFNALVWHVSNLYLLSNIQFGFIAMGIAVAFVEVEGSFMGIGPRGVYHLGLVSGAIALIPTYLIRKRLVGNESNACMLFEWLISLASAALVLALWRNELRPLGRLLSLAPLAYLGRISYGLYVYHSFVLAAVIREWGGSRVDKLLGFFITIAIAAISWHLFEKPINNLKRFAPYSAAMVADNGMQMDKNAATVSDAIAPTSSQSGDEC
jgi:peptidoglycan/LPS O-acetylase OafA/YrhL